jgi:hypothetical protein
MTTDRSRRTFARPSLSQLAKDREEAVMRLAMTLATIATLAGTAWADDKEDLDRAAKKVSELQSYSFKYEIQVESPLGALPGGQIPAMEGKFQKEVGLHITAGDRGEFFRAGEKCFTRQGQNEWQAVESPPADGQQQGARPRGRRLGGMIFRNLKAPHEELAGFGKGLKEVKKDEKAEKVGDKECSVYGGDLSEEGIKNSPLGKMMGQFGQFGGAGLDVSGKAKAWVDGSGSLVKFEMTTKISGEFNGQAFEFSMARICEMSEAGKTKVQIPEGVQKLLGEKSQDKKPEEKKDF